MTKGILQRNAESDGNQLNHVYAVVSPSAIIKAGGEFVLRDVSLSDFVIRSDFPCYVSLDGTPISSGPDASPWWRIRRHVSEISIRLHGGNGGLDITQAYGRHAVLVIEGAPGLRSENQLEHIVPTVEMLPSFTWEENGIVAPSAIGVTQWNTPANPFLVNGVAPSEVWITAISLRLASTGVETSLGTIYRFTAYKEDVPVGDRQTLFNLVLPWLNPNPAFWPLPLAIRVPIASMMQQYAAETPRIVREIYHDVQGADRDVLAVYQGHYRL